MCQDLKNVSNLASSNVLGGWNLGVGILFSCNFSILMINDELLEWLSKYDVHRKVFSLDSAISQLSYSLNFYLDSNCKLLSLLIGSKKVVCNYKEDCLKWDNELVALLL